MNTISTDGCLLTKNTLESVSIITTSIVNINKQTRPTPYPYQDAFLYQVIHSFLCQDYTHSSQQWDRQAGKSEAIIRAALACFLFIPVIQQLFPSLNIPCPIICIVSTTEQQNSLLLNKISSYLIPSSYTLLEPASIYNNNAVIHLITPYSTKNIQANLFLFDDAIPLSSKYALDFTTCAHLFS